MTDGSATDERWVPVDVAAASLGVSPAMILRWCVSGEIRSEVSERGSRAVLESEVILRASLEPPEATALGRRLEQDGSVSAREDAARRDVQTRTLQRGVRERSDPDADRDGRP
jgi:hypothetical protein